MSLLPYLNDFVDDVYRRPFSNLYDQHFGLGLLNDDLLLRRPSFSTLSVPFRSGYSRLFRPSLPEDSGVSSISNKKDKFKINLDVQQFKPEEINVKVADGYVTVEGKHEEKEDKHGFISRQFTRRYKLPDNVLQEQITGTISSDGVLSIIAPKKIEAIEGSGGRSIPISQTNQPALKKSSERQEKMES